MFVSKFTISLCQTADGLWQVVMLSPFTDHRGSRVWARGRWDYSRRDHAEQEALQWAHEEQLHYVPVMAQDHKPVPRAQPFALAF